MLIFIGLIILFIPNVYAGLTQLDILLTFDVIDDDEFNLKWDGGNKYYKWNESIPDDETITVSIYRDLNESVVCAEQSSEFSNLTAKMGDVVMVCQKLADNNNLSIAMEMSDLQYSQGLQTEKLTNCKTDLADANVKANLYDTCNVQRIDCNNNFNTCTTNLDNKKQSGKSTPFIAGIVMGIIGFFVGKGKKETASEMSDEGYDETY